MTDNSAQQIAIEAVEKKLVAAKREARFYEIKGLPMPDYLATRIKNLKGAAVALRNGNSEEE